MDDRNEKLGYRLRENQINKLPITLVIGDDEVNQGSVNVRRYGSKDAASMSLNSFIAMINDEVALYI